VNYGFEFGLRNEAFNCDILRRSIRYHRSPITKRLVRDRRRLSLIQNRELLERLDHAEEENCSSQNQGSRRFVATNV